MAYQVLGTGSTDLLFCYGLGSDVEFNWQAPMVAMFLNRLASLFRLIIFDRRATGASDGVPRNAVPTLEEWTEDIAAVLDAAGSEHAAMLATLDTGPIAIVYTATHPERIRSLILLNTFARLLVREQRRPVDNLGRRHASAVCDSFDPEQGLPCRDRSDPIDRETCATGEEPFERFVHQVRGRLQRALVAAYGPEIGREAAADALTWAWENWTKVEAMTNPGGYLYRVGQSRARRYRRQQRATPGLGLIAAQAPGVSSVGEDVDLRRALGRLTTRQRTAVLLVHGHAYTLEETAQTLGCSISTLRNHLQRGLSRLRRELGVGDG